MSSSVGIFSSLYQEFHRDSMQSKVSESVLISLEKLFFSKEDFLKIDWKEKEREFELNGKLYDVSKIGKTKDGFEIYCLNDSEEEGIIYLFNEWKKSNGPIGKSKIQFQPLFCNQFDFDIEIQNQGEPITLINQQGFYKSVVERIPSPPPEERYSCSLINSL
ncbi:MAG: hypothetical protein HYR67_15015 [Bacteroidetes bacterium]|nr:hypothetical protein [Bacteroidota bacterium]